MLSNRVVRIGAYIFLITVLAFGDFGSNDINETLEAIGLKSDNRVFEEAIPINFATYSDDSLYARYIRATEGQERGSMLPIMNQIMW